MLWVSCSHSLLGGSGCIPRILPGEEHSGCQDSAAAMSQWCREARLCHKDALGGRHLCLTLRIAAKPPPAGAHLVGPACGAQVHLILASTG